MAARSNSGNGSVMDVIDEELWRACAGPQAEVPREGEKVFYFPQGHIQQLEALMSQDLNQQIPLFNLSSQLLCHVVNVQLEAEPETDEVFARVTLQPEADQTEPVSPDSSIPDRPSPVVRSFSKILTPSDTSSHGGFSVLRKHAIECLPPLDMSRPNPSQELIAKDLHGHVWHFKHIFRGQPKRHLLTTGWTTFVSAKKLVAGDTFILLSGDNGEMRVGARRARQLSTITPSVISSQSMLLGVFASASHAFSTKTLFTIILKPRTTRFIVGVEKYLQAVKMEFYVGMRFKMNFGDEDDPGTSFTGTIVEIGAASIKWPNSMWRSLKVQWDELSAIYRPERVSPWEIEPLDPPAPEPAISLNQLDRNKRPREPTDDHWIHATYSGPAGHHESATFSYQGRQELANQVFSPFTGNLNNRNSTMNESISLDSALPEAGCLIDLPSSAKSLSSSLTDISDKPSQDSRKTENGNTGCRLFGVDLQSNHEKEITFPVREFGQNSEVPKSSERQNVNEAKTRKRSCIKVHMEGVAIGRAVNLRALDGYEGLVNELERMFELQGGELINRKNWEIAFTDDEGDKMRVGDDPWLEFCSIARHIMIYARGTIQHI